MDKDFVISKATTLSEAQIAIDWARDEGWNPGIHDAATLFAAAPDAFFIGKLAGTPVVVASGAIYNRQFGFFGLLIAKPDYRGRGFGLAITEACLKHFGNAPTGLDGVIDMQGTYVRKGFVLKHRNLRHKIVGRKLAKPFPNIVSLNTLPFEKILKFDTQHFPAERRQFLQAWLQQPDGFSCGYLEKNALVGYGLIRPCHVGYKIGPLFAQTPKIAEELLLTLIAHAENQPVLIDMPQPNSAALQLVQKYNMEMVFETGRMYRGQAPELPLQTIYGLTTLEMG